MDAQSEKEFALEALSSADAALRELHDNCCEPNRSPRMNQVEQTLGRAREGVENGVTSADEASPVIETLEDVGAQIGSLQIACCTPARMPLYASMLSDLAKAQRAVSRLGGLGH